LGDRGQGEPAFPSKQEALACITSVTPLFVHVSGSKNQKPSLCYPSESLQNQGEVWSCMLQKLLGKHLIKRDSWILIQSWVASRWQHCLPSAPGQQSPSQNASSPLSQSLPHLQGKGTVISVLSQKSVPPVKIPTVGERLY